MRSRSHRGTTLTVLISLLVGALRLHAEGLSATARRTPAANGGVLAAALVGAGVVFALDRYTDDLEYLVRLGPTGWNRPAAPNHREAIVVLALPTPVNHQRPPVNASTTSASV